ncbi:fasciclin domain-containing protein [Arthrobacter sp. NPDC090010]|uniref:fasciclin domain-containing protein n=1 Tax=Arthrobacter sp. NPDC090010 TaxID=3363942 RepID=UPI003802328A
MKKIQRGTVLIGLSMAATLGLAACGGGGGTASSSSSSMPDMPSMSPSATQSSMDPSAGLVGPGCQAYAAANPSGPASVEGMSADPVAVAASHNPLLKTLVQAVSGKLNPKVNLVNTLDSSEFTVFAPVDSAFAKIDAKTIDGLKTDSATLSKILTYHVVPGQIEPASIAGTHTTVEGQKLTVSGSGDSLKVNGANVICGGVRTANATVYLVDSVLMPPAK